jgi:hypothetical protein
MIDCSCYTRELLEKRKKEIEEDMRDRMHPISYYQYTILKKELDAINMELRHRDGKNFKDYRDYSFLKFEK